MKRKSVERRQTARRPYSLSKKTDVLAIFERERTKGTPDSEIVERCGVSQSTLYRWIRETSVRTSKWDNACREKLNLSIASLSSGKIDCKWLVLESVFTFASWLHWPARPDYIPTGVASMLSLYALKTEGRAFASDLPEQAQQAICRNVLLHSFGNIASGFDFDLPVFRTDELDDQPFTIRDLIGEGCGALLAMAEEPDRRLSPSLNKIIYLMLNGAFRYKWNVGRGTLEKAWKEYLPAAPFFYVEMYHSTLDWMLYPDSHLFVSKVDELISDAALFPAYFRRCKAIASAIASLMPKGSGSVSRFPKFPPDLPPEEVRVAALTSVIKSTLRGYRSADR